MQLRHQVHVNFIKTGSNWQRKKNRSYNNKGTKECTDSPWQKDIQPAKWTAATIVQDKDLDAISPLLLLSATRKQGIQASRVSETQRSDRKGRGYSGGFLGCVFGGGADKHNTYLDLNKILIMHGLMINIITNNKLYLINKKLVFWCIKQYYNKLI